MCYPVCGMVHIKDPLLLIRTCVYTRLLSTFPWVVMPRLHKSGPFQGSYGPPRETTQHLLGPIWATFRPTKFKFHYVARQILYFTADHPNCAKCTYFSFGLILRDIPNSITPQNHPPPATDSGRTSRTPLYLPVQTVPPYSLPAPPPQV